LPLRLQYVFLNGDRETPVIISDMLSNVETQRLVATLDMKGICLSLCTHRVLMEQDHKLVREHQ
jgi:hypothetical protein